jgi:N-acyl-D-aspartate/D-glutamate deacylase
MSFDLVIRNGTVVDGSGLARYRADVGVVGDRIASIGRIRDKGKSEIDAEGHVVAPGFIEVHSHMDAQVFWDPVGTSPAWHGITTTVMGNCGFTLAPCRESEKDLCLRNLERAEDMDRATLLEGIRWGWESFAEYFDVVDKLPKGINYAGFIGHSALRTYVMGQRAFEGAATADDMAAMTRELESAMRAGAIGFSTSRSQHFTSDDKPVASRVATWEEVRGLVGVMGRLNTGLFEITPDNWGDDADRAAKQAAIRDLAVESGRPVTYITIKLPAQGNAWREMMALTEDAAARGGRLWTQVIGRQFQSVIGFGTRLPFDHLPTWSVVRGKPAAEQLHAMRDPATRARLVQEAMNGPYGNRAVGPEMRPPNWDIMMVLDAPTGPYRTVAELAREQGTTPADVLIDIGISTNLERFFAQPIGNHELDDVLTLLRHPHSIVGGTDSGAHVSQILDSSIPSHLLAYWVRQERAFTLEQGVRKLSFDPAMAFGIRQRGLLAEGFIADLVVFDPDRVSPGMPVAARDLPANGRRLKQKAEGFAATIVGGEVLMRNNEPTGATPGRLLRGPLAAQR